MYQTKVQSIVGSKKALTGCQIKTEKDKPQLLKIQMMEKNIREQVGRHLGHMQSSGMERSSRWWLKNLRDEGNRHKKRQKVVMQASGRAANRLGVHVGDR